jgi:D-alanyl-D-alanine carboxypeptidase
MKYSKAPIWQKKRKKKRYKKAVHTKDAVHQVKKILSGHPHKLPALKKTPPAKKPYKKKIKSFKILFRLRHILQRHDSDIQLVLFPLILLVILIILYALNKQFLQNASNHGNVFPDDVVYLHPYPYVQGTPAPEVTAQAAIILDRGSQVILYSKNPQLRFSMASTTKIMTALIALGHYKSDDIITVKRSYVPGSGLDLTAGEQFRFMDIMYAMLLPSANDAAQAIADNYPGGSSAFVAQMNKKAKSLHLTNTHYADPTGLDDDGDYTTVVDLARLASYAESNPTFVGITSTKYKTISTANSGRIYSLTSTNDLLGIDGVIGIKTGTTEGAGEVLVTSMVRNGHNYIIIVMDSTDRFGDTSKLLNYIDTDVKYVMPPGPK